MYVFAPAHPTLPTHAKQTVCYKRFAIVNLGGKRGGSVSASHPTPRASGGQRRFYRKGWKVSPEIRLGERGALEEGGQLSSFAGQLANESGGDGVLAAEGGDAGDDVPSDFVIFDAGGDRV